LYILIHKHSVGIGVGVGVGAGVGVGVTTKQLKYLKNLHPVISITLINNSSTPLNSVGVINEIEGGIVVTPETTR
jgi:hypothetical protein